MTTAPHRRFAGRSFWATRPFEWAVVVAVVTLALVSVNRQYRDLEGQAEYAAIQSVLGSMRTALVLDFLQRRLAAESPHAGPLKNPVLLLQPLPTYAGDLGMARQSEARPGNWLFDAECVCVGYRPLNPEWLEPAQDFPAIWFQLRDNHGAPELTPMRAYRWHGVPIN